MLRLATLARIAAFSDKAAHERHVIPIGLEHTLTHGHAQAAPASALWPPPPGAPVTAFTDIWNSPRFRHTADLIFPNS